MGGLLDLGGIRGMGGMGGGGLVVMRPMMMSTILEWGSGPNFSMFIYSLFGFFLFSILFSLSFGFMQGYLLESFVCIG